MVPARPGVPQWNSRPLAVRSAPIGAGLGDDAQHLPHEICCGDRRYTAGVIAGGNFADIAADEMLASERADDDLCLARAEAADFWHARTDRPGGIETVDIDRDIGWTITGHPVDLLDEPRAPHRFEIVKSDASEALILAPFDVVGRETTAPQPDLDHAPWIDQSFLDAAPEGRGMI